MPTQRVMLRIVFTFKLFLATAIAATILYGMVQFNPTQTLSFALTGTTMASTVYCASCVYHIIRLVQLESRRV